MRRSHQGLFSILFAVAALLLLVGMSGTAEAKDAPAGTPVFHMDYSVYPSWSVFGAQEALGQIDGAEGKIGPIEEKHNVDIVLHKRDYVPTLDSYSAKKTDALTTTNIDVMALAVSRPTVAIFPTSRSHGGDALVVEASVGSFDDLKGITVHGAAASVSEYMFRRCLKLNGKDAKNFTFADMDPGAAAKKFQGKDPAVKAVALWNPELKQTLAARADAKVLCDSTKLPDEILDMVVVAKDSLAKDGGDRFAKALAETYYDFSAQLADPAKKDAALKALSKHFLDLDPKVIETLLTQTQFYSTVDKGIAVFTPDHLNPVIKTISETWTDAGHLKAAPAMGFDKDKALFFDASFMNALK